MIAAVSPSRGLARMLSWRRLRFAFFAALPFGLILGAMAATPIRLWIVRVMVIALFTLLGYGVFEQWPARLSPRIARWVLQLVGVVVAVPIGAVAAYWLTTGELQFWRLPARLIGFSQLCFVGVLFAPWMALGAMVRQREALARDQALSFQLERSELERQALDARLHLLQGQVQPHFLFNTLANVRALVNAGSPQAPAVLDSLIAYLRAAVPHLDQPATTIRQELQLLQAYLDLMHMRMPDRLQFSLYAEEAAEGLRCPPMSFLTLVENAVRRGIDPSEEGGRIEVSVQVRDGRVVARVTDTGVGLVAQVHRSVVVNLNSISHVTRGLNETADIHLKGRNEVLPVSRSYLHLFHQM